MRALWLKAPLLLRRHPPLLAAVALVSLIAALAAAGAPLLRAAVKSESLAGELKTMSPLSAGLVVDVRAANPIAADRARRAAAARVTAPHLGRPTLSSRVYAEIANANGTGVAVFAVARTDAVDHVKRLTPPGRRGVWISTATAKTARLKPGDTLALTVHQTEAVTRIVRLPVAGIYEQLDADLENPYWTNWVHEIRPLTYDSPLPPAFVLMSESQLIQLARAISPYSYNRFEYPVDPHRLTFSRAEALLAQLDALGARLTSPGSGLGCRARRNCTWSSSLEAALLVADHDVGAVAPTISLLSNCGLLIALMLAVATGVFLVRRRADEAHALFARGESAGAFATRAGIEAVLPAAAGAGAGAAVAVLALRGLAAGGALDHGTATAALWRAAGGGALVVLGVVAGAAVAFPRRAGGPGHPIASRLARVPWELAPLALAALLLVAVIQGHGVTRDAGGATHPRLLVFLIPVVAIAGIAGLVARAARRALPREGRTGPTLVFLALRRLRVARGALTAVFVAFAVAFGCFAYAATLSSSLHRSVELKALISNGSDVQAVVDPGNVVTSPFAFPVAIVEVDESNASLPDGTRVDVIAGDPRAMARAIRWGHGVGADPRPLLARVHDDESGALTALATPGTPVTNAIIDQGARIPIRIVGRASFPGTTARRPAIVVSHAALRRAAHRLRILDPAPLSGGLLWAKGDPHRIEPALLASNLAPTYLTTLDHIRHDAAVRATTRSFRYIEVIGVAAAVLALVALLLYLQARQRAQAIASAFSRRMGLAPATDTAAVACEAAAIALVAAIAGAAVATLAALPIVAHVDALPDYAPAPVYAAPWGTLVLATLATTVVAALIGAASVRRAARVDVAEALRVA